jgi:hypothetical protein
MSEERPSLLSFATDLVADTNQIQGRELDLDGKTYLVTTEEQIRAWIGWHLHSVDEDDDRIAHCSCGWSAGPFASWAAYAIAADQHREEGIAALVSGTTPSPAVSVTEPSGGTR